MLTIEQCNLLSKATTRFHPNPQEALKLFHIVFDKEGPYKAALLSNCLVNNSGEELAIAFMTMWNMDHPGTY